MQKNSTAESGRQRWKCQSCKTRTTLADDTAKPGYDEQQVAANAQRLRKRIKKGAKRFIITCATNNTPKHSVFFRALKHCADHKGAELIIVPIHYKNISLYTASQEFKKTWAKELEQYLIDETVLLGGGIQVCADIKIPATTVNPLEGLQTIGGQRTSIFGHPQLAMRPVAAPSNRLPKRVWATGAVTQKNYSRTKAGAKADFHHIVGALYVEVVGNQAFVRQLIADHTGCFYDLDEQFTPDGVTGGHNLLSLTTGDEHELWMASNVRRATYGKGGIVDTLKPQFIVRHDVLDGYAGSHHHEKDPLVQYRKHVKGLNDYRKELDRVVEHINATTPEGAVTWLVASNHHDHLKKWLDRADANRDHTNAILIAELQLAMRQAIHEGRDPDPFRLYLEPRLTCQFQFLSRNQPALLGGVDHSQHGDIGINGARGSAASYAKTTFKMTVAHSHGACIEKSVIQVGTSTGHLEYENGLGTHTNTHCLQYPNGKRTTIDIIGARWRA